MAGLDPQHLARAKRWLATPTASLILGLAMIVLVASWHQRSDVKQTLIGTVLRRDFADVWPPQFQVYIVKDVSANGIVSWRLIDEGKDSWDELSKLLQATPEKVFHASILVRPVTDGSFAATQSTYRLTLSWWGGRVSRADRDAIEPVFAGWLQECGREDLATAVREKSASRTLWSGHLVNLLGLAMLCAFGYSFVWLLDVPQWRARRRAKNGQCAKCGYDLSGTRRDDLKIAICPECGEHNLPHAHDYFSDRGA